MGRAAGAEPDVAAAICARAASISAGEMDVAAEPSRTTERRRIGVSGAAVLALSRERSIPRAASICPAVGPDWVDAVASLLAIWCCRASIALNHSGVPNAGGVDCRCTTEGGLAAWLALSVASDGSS